MRQLLGAGRLVQMPCCYDALSARLVEEAGFPLTFVSGFGAAAAKGLPDTGLVSFGEMRDTMRSVVEALESTERKIPCIGDGDTGYGNAVNAKRTVTAYARAGLAGIMIEDQVSPKRCGHTRDKAVVPFDEAVSRVKAAVDAAREASEDSNSAIVIVARTDARATDGMDEALRRCIAFAEVGADVTFLEAPRSREEMQTYCNGVPGIKMANLLEGGLTPILSPAELERIGFTLAAYPFATLNPAIVGMRASLHALKSDGVEARATREQFGLPFEELQRLVGFPQYYEEESRYKANKK